MLQFWKKTTHSLIEKFFALEQGRFSKIDVFCETLYFPSSEPHGQQQDDTTGGNVEEDDRQW